MLDNCLGSTYEIYSKTNIGSWKNFNFDLYKHRPYSRIEDILLVIAILNWYLTSDWHIISGSILPFVGQFLNGGFELIYKVIILTSITLIYWEPFIADGIKWLLSSRIKC